MFWSRYLSVFTAWKKGLDEPFSIYLAFGSLICIVFVLYEWNIRTMIYRKRKKEYQKLSFLNNQ